MSERLNIQELIYIIDRDKHYATQEEFTELEILRTDLMFFGFIHDCDYITVEQYLNLIEDFSSICWFALK